MSFAWSVAAGIITAIAGAAVAYHTTKAGTSCLLVVMACHYGAVSTAQYKSQARKLSADAGSKLLVDCPMRQLIVLVGAVLSAETLARH